MFIMVESTPSSFSISTENFGESCSVDFGSAAGSGTKSNTYFTKFVYNLADSHPALWQAGQKVGVFLSPNYSLKAASANQ